MVFTPIGITKNIEVYRDRDYQYHDDKYILTLKNTRTLRLQDNKSNISDFVFSFSIQNAHIIRVRSNTWIIKLSEDFFIFDLDTIRVRHKINEYVICDGCKKKPYQDIHIVRYGLYVVYDNCCFYYNFDGEEIASLVKNKLDTFHFYENFVMIRKNIYYVFYNLDQLSEENKKLFSSDIDIFQETNEKVTVNFKDKKKDINLDVLSNFNSEFINEQLSSGGEIFLDIEYKNFDFDNLETLKYLDSKFLERIDVLNIIK